MADTTNKCECGHEDCQKTAYEIVTDEGIYCSECGAFWDSAHRGMFRNCPYCGAKLVERTEAEDKEALLPCPFCGGEASIGTFETKPITVDWDTDGDARCGCCPNPPKVTESSDSVTYYVVHCLNTECPVKPCANDGYLYRSSAVAAWNKRALPEQPADDGSGQPGKPDKPGRPHPGKPDSLYPPRPGYQPKPAPVFSVQRELRYDGIPVVNLPA